MPFKDLREFIALLETKGEVRRVKVSVDLDKEVGGIVAELDARRGPGAIFENISGYRTPIAVNMLGSRKRLALAFECKEEELLKRMMDGIAHPVEPKTVPSGPCKEEIRRDDKVDLMEFPVPYWHEEDGGRYMGTLCGCVTRDPDTGEINVGAYRLMIRNKHQLTFATQRFNSHGYLHFLKYQAAKKPMPMAVIIGMEPTVAIASCNPVPSGVTLNQEYAFAGGWRRAPVELVKCETIDLEVPATTEIVLEGYVLPELDTKGEGPHGEMHGYYGSNNPVPLYDVKCVTHRKSPIMVGLREGVVGESSVIRSLGRSATTMELLTNLGVPGIRTVWYPEETSAAYMCVVSANIKYRGLPAQIMQAVWAIPSSNNTKWVVVVDEDVEPSNLQEVLWAISTKVLPHRDIWVTPPIDRTGFGPLTRGEDKHSSRIGIDATSAFKETFPKRLTVSKELKALVLSRWKDYGLD